jgi:phospholipase C
LNYQDYKTTREIKAGEEIVLILDVAAQGNWYDLVIRELGNSSFGLQLAGRLETGVETTTDPLLA